MVGQQRFELGYPIEDEGTTRAVMGDRAAGGGEDGHPDVDDCQGILQIYDFMIL